MAVSSLQPAALPIQTMLQAVMQQYKKSSFSFKSHEMAAFQRFTCAMHVCRVASTTALVIAYILNSSPWQKLRVCHKVCKCAGTWCAATSRCYPTPPTPMTSSQTRSGTTPLTAPSTQVRAGQPAPVSLQLALDSCAVDSMRYIGVQLLLLSRALGTSNVCPHTGTSRALQLFWPPTLMMHVRSKWSVHS